MDTIIIGILIIWLIWPKNPGRKPGKSLMKFPPTAVSSVENNRTEKQIMINLNVQISFRIADNNQNI